MKKQSQADKLRSIPFFADLSAQDLRQVAAIAEERNYQAGEVIVQEYSSAERFFIIYRGKIEITKRFEDGEEFVLAVHSDGDFFGEIALLDQGPRSATARAMEPTTALEFSRADFETLLSRAPHLAYAVMRELSSRLRETGALLVSHLQRKNRELSEAYRETLHMLVQAVEARDPYTRGHTMRVHGISQELGSEMGLPEEEMHALELAALLHDLGKIGLSDSILLKPGPLSSKEYAQVKEYPRRGGELMSGIAYLKRSAGYVLHHHERYDGGGYPGGLAGRDIPLPSRILAVADAFEALTSERPHRPPMSKERALAEVEAGSGAQFDPEVVAAFLRVVRSGRLEGILQGG